MKQTITVDGIVYNVIDELPEAGYDPTNAETVLDIRRAYPERTNRVENELVTYELYEIILEDFDTEFVALRRYWSDVEKEIYRGIKFQEVRDEEHFELFDGECFDEETGEQMKKSGKCICKFPCGLAVNAKYNRHNHEILVNGNEILFDPDFKEGDPRRTAKYLSEFEGYKWNDLMSYQKGMLHETLVKRIKLDETKEDEFFFKFDNGLCVECHLEGVKYCENENGIIFDPEVGILEREVRELIDQIPDETIFAKLHEDEDLYAVVSGYENDMCHQPEYDLHEIDESVISDAIEEFRGKGDNDYIVEIYKVNSQIYRLNDDGEVRDDEWRNYENIVYSSRPESYVNRIWEEARETNLIEALGDAEYELIETELDCILTGYEDDMPGLDQMCKFRLFYDIPESMKLLADKIDTLIRFLSLSSNMRFQANVAEIRARAVKAQRLIQIMLGLRIDD